MQGSAGGSAAATCSATPVPMARRGGGSGKRSAGVAQWEGKEREAGKGRSPGPDNSHRCRRSATPRRLLAGHQRPPPPRTLARATRAHSGPRTAALGPSALDALAAPQYAPRGRGRQSGGCGPGPVRRGGGLWPSVPRRLGCLSSFRKDVGFNSGMSGPCSEGWKCHQNLAHWECQQTVMKGYGVYLLLHKDEEIASG